MAIEKKIKKFQINLYKLQVIGKLQSHIQYTNQPASIQLNIVWENLAIKYKFDNLLTKLIDMLMHPIHKLATHTSYFKPTWKFHKYIKLALL